MDFTSSDDAASGEESDGIGDFLDDADASGDDQSDDSFGDFDAFEVTPAQPTLANSAAAAGENAAAVAEDDQDLASATPALQTPAESVSKPSGKTNWFSDAPKKVKPAQRSAGWFIKPPPVHHRAWFVRSPVRWFAESSTEPLQMAVEPDEAEQEGA